MCLSVTRAARVRQDGPAAASDSADASAGRSDRRIGRVGVDHVKMRGELRVEQSNLLPLQQLQQLAGLWVRDEELDLHGKRAGELEETTLVQDMVPPESGHRPEGGAAANVELIRLFQQPF